MTQPRRIQFGRIFCSGLLLILSIALASDQALAQLETRSITKVVGNAAAVVSGDFNGDGNMDLAITDPSGFSVLLGKGDGTFQKSVRYPYSGLGGPIATADFNGDGKLDLAIGNALGSAGSGVSVFLGNGDGTFEAPVVSPTHELVIFLALGDFNNDHKLDLAIIDPPYVTVLLGNGEGTFQAPIDNSSFPDYPIWLAVGDFSNDHRLSVVVVGYLGTNTDMGVLLGNGNGTLQSSLTYPLNDTPGSVAVGDFSHDGNLDLAIGYRFGGVAVLLGNGDGSFQPEKDYDGGGGTLTVRDMNGDGNLDIITEGVYLMLGNGDGTFGPAQLFPGGGSALAVGDLNGDRKPDVVTVDSIPVGAIALLNTGVVSFSPSSPVSFPTQLVHTASSPKTVPLTNTGTTTLSISSIKISGQFETSNTCGDSVAAGLSCTISVTFSPVVPGLRQGLVTIIDSASSKPQVIEVSGLATALRLSPAALNFGDQKVGTSSPPQQITVTNESDSTVTFTTIGIGFDSEDFPESQNCGSQLKAGASCTATVTFMPTKTGRRKGLAYFDVTGGADPTSVVLTGTGTDALK